MSLTWLMVIQKKGAEISNHRIWLVVGNFKKNSKFRELGGAYEHEAG
jgi:hypothetical protein